MDTRELAPFAGPERAIFWAAPPSFDSEFSPEDPLALDYLGQQMGLALLPRFTTRTSRAQYYAVVLYGLRLVKRALGAYGQLDEDRTRKRLFERWERFWALSVLESHGGEFGRGHPDTMRGVRGARRHWFAGSSDLPLDFKLISRQSELGGLGAYLSSLRATGLVIDGTMDPSPVAHDILDAFFCEPRPHDRRTSYDRYALDAMNPEKERVARKFGGVTLRRLGRLTRLGAIRSRPRQCERLREVLFGKRADRNTRIIGQLVAQADRQGVYESRALLDAAIDGTLAEELPDDIVALLRGARAFGDAVVAVLEYFNRVYDQVYQRGGMAQHALVATQALPDAHRARLHGACARALAEPRATRVRIDRADPIPHLTAFTHLLEQLAHGTAQRSHTDCLDALLDYHRLVQRARRGYDGWLLRDRDHLVLGAVEYKLFRADVPFPDFKFGAVRSLLRDLSPGSDGDDDDNTGEQEDAQ